MGDSLGLIGKRLLLLLNDGGSTGGTETDQASWLRGTVRAVSVIGLASPGVEVSPGEGTTTAASGLTVSVYKSIRRQYLVVCYSVRKCAKFAATTHCRSFI